MLVIYIYIRCFFATDTTRIRIERDTGSRNYANATLYYCTEGGSIKFQSLAHRELPSFFLKTKILSWHFIITYFYLFTFYLFIFKEIFLHNRVHKTMHRTHSSVFVFYFLKIFDVMENFLNSIATP